MDLLNEKHRHNERPISISLLVHANLSLHFWAKAFISFVHIINVFPSDGLHGDTCYHKLFNKIPDYTHFKVFECACYPNLRPYNVHKFAFLSMLIVSWIQYSSCLLYLSNS